MKSLFIFFILIISTNIYSFENKLIDEKDLKFLFNNSSKKWNESVVFFDKKKSMSKVNSDDEIYSLKSIFKNGSVTIKPYFNKNKVIKIDLKYEFENFDPDINNLIFKHYTKLDNNYCTNILNKMSIIIIEINKCD